MNPKHNIQKYLFLNASFKVYPVRTTSLFSEISSEFLLLTISLVFFGILTNNIAIINHDDSKIIDNYIKYIDKGSNIIDIKDDKNEFQDALYSNKVDAIIIIPENFTKDLLANKNPSVKIKKSNQSFSMITELQTNKYFNLINLYANFGMDEELIIENKSTNQNWYFKVVE